MKETNTILILTASLILSLCLNFYLYFLRPPMEKEIRTEIVKKDTIVDYIKDFDTVYVQRDKYHYETIHLFDTITNKEKVFIQDTLHNYAFNEKDYDLDIEAVRLDKYKLDIHSRDTITVTEVVNQTIYKPKKNKIAIGLQGGYGYGFKSKELTPYIGIGININLFEK